MTIEQVIEAGRMVEDGFSWWHILAFSSFFIIAGILCVIGDRLDSELSFSLGVFFFICGLFVLMLGDVPFKEQRKDEWMQNYVTPYVESLPVVKSDITKIELLGEAESGMYDGSHDGIRVKVFYLDESVRSYEGIARVQMSLDKDETEYVEYQMIEQDLGNGVKMGLIYPKIYLKSDHRFE